MDASENPLQRPAPQIHQTEQGWQVVFQAMASPCEILIDGGSHPLALRLARLAARETWRIEHKFSRYLPDNPMAQINASNGKPVRIDSEIERMLDYANQCHELSEGAFDVTSGALRRVWRFDGSDRIPEPEAVSDLLPLIGWNQVQRGPGWVCLSPGMELDFGGIGKEYAVDRVTVMLTQERMKRDSEEGGILVNFGGDLMVSGPRLSGAPWQVGVESALSSQAVIKQLAHRQGGLATSGDARRYLLREGKRYSHILDPRTGWPVDGAPASVTVAGPSCTVAGMLATFAMLRGDQAEAFLRTQTGIRFWLQWPE